MPRSVMKLLVVGEPPDIHGGNFTHKKSCFTTPVRTVLVADQRKLYLASNSKQTHSIQYNDDDNRTTVRRSSSFEVQESGNATFEEVLEHAVSKSEVPEQHSFLQSQ